MIQSNTFEGGIISDVDVSKVQPNQLVFPTVGIRVFNKAGKGLIATLLPGNMDLFHLTDGFQMMGGVEYDGIGFIFSYNAQTNEGEVGTYPSPNLTSTGFTNAYTPLHNFQIYWPVATITDLRTTLFNFNIHFPVDVVAKKSYDNSIDLYFIDFYNVDRVINCGFKLDGTTNNRVILPGNFDGALNHVPFTNKEIKVNSADVAAGGYFKPGNVFVYLRYLTSNYAATPFVKEIGPLSLALGDTQLTHAGLSELDFSTGVNLQTDRKITLNLTNIDTNFAYLQVGIVRYSAFTENGPAQRDTWLISNVYPILNANKIFTIYGNEPQELLTYDDIIKTPFLYPISKTQTQIENRLLRANVKRKSLGYDRDALIYFASTVSVGEFYHDGDFATKTVTDYIANGGLYAYQSADNVYKYLGYFKEQIYPFAVVFKFSDGTLSEAFPVAGNIATPEKGLYQFRTWAQACGAVPNQNRITGVSFDASGAYMYYAANPTKFTDVVGLYFVRSDRIDNLICQGVMMHGYHGVRVTTDVSGTGIIRSCSFNGEITADVVYPTDNTTRWNPSDAAIMPLFRGYMPMSHGKNSDVFYGYTDDYNPPTGTGNMKYWADGYDRFNEWSGVYGRENITFPARWLETTNPSNPSMFNSLYEWDNKHGLFSPDLLFDNGAISVPDATHYIKPIFSFHDNTAGGYASSLDPFLITATRKILPRTWDTNSSNQRSIIGIDLNPTQGINYMALAATDQFVPVNATRVDHLQGKGRLNFTGYLTGEGTNIGFSAISSMWNKDIGTSAYIGVEDVSSAKSLRELYAKLSFGLFYQNSEQLCIVNLYKNKIETTWIAGINNSFNVSSVQYSPISELITLTDLQSVTTYQLFKGDCFLQKVWFRTHRWYAMSHNNDNNEDQNSPCSLQPDGFGRSFMDNGCNWYQHGFMVGMTVECKYNAGMRNEVIGLNTTDKFFKYSFFPKALQNGIDLDQWVAIEPGQYGQEAVEINAGYDKALGDRTTKGYDFTQPVFELNKPNRVYASDAHTPGAFLDGYRSIAQNSYQDFATEDGDIMYIGKNLTYPFIIQKFGTNQIFINEKSIGQTDQGQDIITGTSLTFFSDRVRKLGFMGTQHKSSVVNGTKGTYGYDFLKNIWWNINTFQLETGLQELRMQDLSGQNLIADELDKVLNLYSPDRTKTDELPDDPLTDVGIVGFTDPDNEEVGMTFLLPLNNSPSLQPTPGVRFYRTMIFNEKIGKFYGDYPFGEHIYFNIGNILLSNHKDNKMFRYNVKALPDGTPNYATYFGNVQDTKISFVINGSSEKQNTSELVKIFNALELEMQDVQPKSIIFTTLYQSGTYQFNTTDFWQMSEYLEHKWKVPIILQDSGTKDAFENNSELRGAWLRVTIVFHANTDIELKSVLSDFDISFI